MPGDALVVGGAPLAPPPVRVPPADGVALLPLVGKNWICLGVPTLPMLRLGVLQLEPLPETLLVLVLVLVVLLLLLLARFIIMLLLASIWESIWGFCTMEGKNRRRIEDVHIEKNHLLAKYRQTYMYVAVMCQIGDA